MLNYEFKKVYCLNFIYKVTFNDFLSTTSNFYLNLIKMPLMPHRHRFRFHRVRAVEWHDPMMDELIEERKRRNDEYHNVYGRGRVEFWESVARRFICVIFYFICS